MSVHASFCQFQLLLERAWIEDGRTIATAELAGCGLRLIDDWGGTARGRNLGTFGAMQSVSCGTLSPSSRAGYGVVAEPEHFASSSSEVYRQQQQKYGKAWLDCNSGRGRGGRAISVARGPVKAKAALGPRGGPGGGFTKERGSYLKVLSSLITDPSDRSTLSAEQKVNDVVAKQASMFQDQMKRGFTGDLQSNELVKISPELLADAYARCGEVCAEYAKTFYLGIFFTVHRSVFFLAVLCGFSSF